MPPFKKSTAKKTDKETDDKKKGNPFAKSGLKKSATKKRKS